MKKLFFAAGILLAGLGVVYAQSKITAPTDQQAVKQVDRIDKAERKTDPKVMADRKTMRLEQTVQLSPEQKEKVHAIYLNEAQQLQGRAVLRKETQESVRKVLTAEQIQKMDMEQAARKEYRKVGMENRKATQKAAPGEVQPK